MKSVLQNVTAAMLVLLCGSALVAQPSGSSDRARPTQPIATTPADDRAMRDHGATLVPSEWVIGQKVLDKDRRSLGRIKDLILDAGDGHVVYALVNRAPREDATPAIVAVPWLAFTWDGTERALLLPVSRDRLAEARTFDAKRWDMLNDAAWTDEVHGYYNVERDAYEHGWPENSNDADASAAPGHDMKDPRVPAGTDDSGRNGETDRNRDADRDQDRDAARDADRSIGDDRPPAPKQYVLASKIEGQTLRGAEDKEIGDVDALVIDANSGRMAFIVAEFGGFLGIGDSKVAVPWDYFKVNDDGHLYTNAVKADEVRTAPRIEREDWSELRDPEFGPRVYKHFGRDANWFQSGFGANMADSDRRDYDALYTTGTQSEVSGTVTRVSEEGSGDAAVRTVVVSTDAGDKLIHLAPVSYIQDNGWALKEGDRVTIKGNTVMVDGKQVLIASSLTGPENKTLELRDSRGQPKWRKVR